MKSLKFSLLLSIVLTGFSSCEIAPAQQSSDRALANKQEQLMQEANSQVGMPAIVNFQERKLAKMVFELRDQENLVCYAYIVSQMTGKLVYVGKCIGFGLPYSVQFTNPMKIEWPNRNGYYDIAIIPQADPNGLFMPTGLSATWLMMIDPKTNEPRPVYFEPEIIVSPFPLL